jgi:hypothetical protein
MAIALTQPAAPQWLSGHRAKQAVKDYPRKPTAATAASADRSKHR